MKTLDPNDLKCCFCMKPIKAGEVVAVIDTQDGKPAVTHLHHSGVEDTLVFHPSQITTGALLMSIADLIRQGVCSEIAFEALEKQHVALPPIQKARLSLLREATKARSGKA